MKIKLIAAFIFGAIAPSVLFAAEPPTPQAPPAAAVKSQSPAELTATRCLICHGDPVAGQQRLAPPFAMVKMHYDSLSEQEFTKAVTAWLKAPSKEKSLMPGAVNRFGLMPAPGCSDADAAAIAKYLYKTDFAMPGQGGMGMGMGRGQGKMGRGPAATATGDANKAAEKCPPANDDAVDPKGVKAQGCGEGCGGGCGCGGACGAEKAKTQAGAVEPSVDVAAVADKKWPIPAAMMGHLQNLEKDITTHQGKEAADHAALSKEIDQHITALISSCTMEGEAHTALHEWLESFREIAKQYAETKDLAVKKEKIRGLQNAFVTFHQQFKVAP